jgi:hypothetical protein
MLHARPPSRALAALLLALCAPTTALADFKLQPTEDVALSIFGDFRFRNEFNLVRSDPDDPMRYRARIRLRMGAKLKILEQLELGFRLTTGNPEDPNSPHETFTSGFSRWNFNVDRAYAKWTPNKLGGSYIMAGKFSNPFVKRLVYGDALLDGDIQPTGVVVAGNVPTETALDAWKILAGTYLFVENKNDAEGVAVVGQTSFHFDLGDHVAFYFGGGIIYIVDPTPGGDTVLLDENQGNATLDTDGDGEDDAFVADFAVVDVPLGVKLRFGAVGLDLGAQLLANLAHDRDNLGFGFGVAVPIELEAADLRLVPYIDLKQLAREATFSAWMQDDHQQGLPYRGLVAGLKITPIRYLTIHAWGIFDQDLDNPADPWATRARLDLNFKI